MLHRHVESLAGCGGAEERPVERVQPMSEFNPHDSQWQIWDRPLENFKPQERANTMWAFATVRMDAWGTLGSTGFGGVEGWSAEKVQPPGYCEYSVGICDRTSRCEGHV